MDVNIREIQRRRETALKLRNDWDERLFALADAFYALDGNRPGMLDGPIATICFRADVVSAELTRSAAAS
jgi:hypothetical protein